MPIIRVPSLFKYYLEGQAEIRSTGRTVGEVLQVLVREFPKIQSHILDNNSQLRRHINLFVNSDNIRDLKNLETQVSENDVIKIVPSVTGG